MYCTYHVLQLYKIVLVLSQDKCVDQRAKNGRAYPTSKPGDGKAEGKKIASVHDTYTVCSDTEQGARRSVRRSELVSLLGEPSPVQPFREGRLVYKWWECGKRKARFWCDGRTVGQSAGAAARRLCLKLVPLFFLLLPKVFTDNVRVGQVEMRCLEYEVSAPDGEEPADPSKDQPWENVREFPVDVWWAGVGKGSLEGLKVTVGRRDEVGFVGGDNDGRGNRGGEDHDDGEYRACRFDSEPHHGLGERWPEEKEEEHGTLVEYSGSVTGVGVDRGDWE